MEIQEVRCLRCNKLLGKIEEESEFEIKCTRCGEIVKFRRCPNTKKPKQYN